jgi:hypothetical protein
LKSDTIIFNEHFKTIIQNNNYQAPKRHIYMEHFNKFEISCIYIIYSKKEIIITTMIQLFINRLEKMEMTIKYYIIIKYINENLRKYL